MNLNFSDLNNQMQDILITYRRALHNGEYDEAKKITVSVLQLFRDTYGVDLDTKPEFDHVFQELMLKMKDELKDTRPSSEEAANKEIEIINMLTSVADGVFKVSDIRRRAMEMDPSSQDLLDAYGEGIKDADDQIKRIQKLKKEYTTIENLFYGKSTPNLKQKIATGKFNVGVLDEITAQISKMNELQINIDNWERQIASDPTKEAMYRGKIDANKHEINSQLSNIKSKLSDVEKNGVNIDSIKDAMSTENSVRMAVASSVTSLRNSLNLQLINDYTQLKNNIINAKNKYGNKYDELAQINIDSADPSTEDGRKSIEDSVKPFLELQERAKKGLKLQKNRKKVYEKSIEEVREEQKILEIDTQDRSKYEGSISPEVRRKIDQEKEYYRQDMLDKLYGNPEKAEKWKSYYNLFKDAKKLVDFTFTDEFGNERNGTYITIDYDKFASDLAGLNPPVGLQDALKLLQLEEYKDRIERFSKYTAGDRSVRKELPSYKKYEAALKAEASATTDAQREAARTQKREAELDMRKELEEDQIYIATNHGATDNHELIANAISNAGSLVKYKSGRLAYKDQPTIAGKVKAFGHNYFSLAGLRTISDAKTPLGKIGTAVLDAGLITISPFSCATKLVYRYTPVIGKEAQAKRYIKKHAGENSSPYEGREDALKMKRRKEYKSQMKGPLKGARAWIKATNDNLFNKERKKQTELDIAERDLQERVFPSIENRYIMGAQAADIEKQELARQNIEQRKTNARTVAGRAYGYNDLIRDTQAADDVEYQRKSILGAALEEHGEDAEKIRYSTTDRPRDRRFRKPLEELGTLQQGLKADQIDYSKPVGSVVQSDTIDRATRQEAIDSTYTARNYIPYTITGVAVGMAGRYAFSRIKTQIEEIIPGETTTVTEKQFKGYESYEETVQVPHTSTVADPNSVPRTVSEFAEANDNVNLHLHRSVWGGERGGYDVDLSSYDHATAFYVDVPKGDGTFKKLAIVIPKDAGKYDYLGQLANRFGLEQSVLEKYIDTATGTFRPDADLYDLAAEISNKTGATQGLTGDKLVEMVFNSEANAYVGAVKNYGGYNGGWYDVTDMGRTLGTKEVVTYTTETITKSRAVWEEISKTVTTPDQVKIVTDATKATIRRRGMRLGTGLAVGHVIEATDKALGGDPTRDLSKREIRQDKPDEVEPGRNRRTRRPSDDWTR